MRIHLRVWSITCHIGSRCYLPLNTGELIIGVARNVNLEPPLIFLFPFPSFRPHSSRTLRVQLEGLGECCEFSQHCLELSPATRSGGNNFNYFLDI